ncbi:MAG TPA: hypothetical protein VK968_18350, partial [Roseimicrobium sp.]|nr:hypothetical protein [Roseimicrobium sp.]
MSPVPLTLQRSLLPVLVFALLEALLIPASAADATPAKVAKPKPELRPRKDPADIAFRRAPMASATRSILIPLSTNLHVAFDTENLNTHAAWAGDSPNLWGSVYHISKDRFYIDYDGRTLWSQPGVFPWKSRKLEKEGFTNSIPKGRFLGISTKDDATTVVYELTVEDVLLPVLVEECFRHRANVPDTLIERRLEIAPSKRSLTFLAHAETGTLLKAPDRLPVVLIDRGTNVLLIAARGTSALKLESAIEDVDYQMPVWREQKNDSVLEYRHITGKQARAYVRIPAHTNDIAVEILSLVASNADSALEMLKSVPKTKIDPPNMTFLTSRDPAKKPSAPVVTDGDKAVSIPAGDESYRIEAFPLPKALEMQVTGMDFLPDGNLIVCTWLGDIYIVEKPTGPAAEAKYRRFARGL